MIQAIEHLLCKLKALSSNPVPHTKNESQVRNVVGHLKEAKEVQIIQS
jgi:hypothetical protein